MNPLIRQRRGVASTWAVLAVFGAALIIGGVIGIFVTGILSFLQPFVPFLFVPVTLVNYTIVPIGFVITLLATLPILVYLARKTSTPIAPA